MKQVKSSEISYTQTLDAWQPFYKEKLTKADAVEIQSNLANFSEVLMRWGKNSNVAVNQ